MLYMMLVFGHLLATSMALGAIVATDLRMLSKLSQDRVRIPPPNDFVARLVSLALLLLYATGAAMLWLNSREHPDFFNPKVQGKLVLVALLTVNAVVLHRYTFPRLGRGRSLARWRARDWAVILLPVALSNCLWMFCAFLGIARAWNHTMSMAGILQIAAALYAVALLGVGVVLATAGRPSRPGMSQGLVQALKRMLAAIGSLGTPPADPKRGVQWDERVGTDRRRRAPAPAARVGAAPRQRLPLPARDPGESRPADAAARRREPALRHI